MTDRFAIEAGGSVLFDAHVGATWNAIRTRYLDISLAGTGGYERCIELLDHYDYCKSEHLTDPFGYAGGIGLLGLNPSRWLTLQLQSGGILQIGDEARMRPWLGASAHVFLSDEVAIGPNVLVLPGWLLDGQTVIAPSFVVMAFPRGANPYRH